MDIQTLEALGVSKEDLADRIIDQAVHTLLYSTGFNPDTDEDTTYESRFKSEIERKVQEAVDKKIAAIAEVHLVPRVGELIEQANMRQTNRFGEPKGEPLTFKEYLAYRAEHYMTEEVNLQAKSKSEDSDSYNWRSQGPRLTVLMKLYIKDSMEAAAKSAVNDINKVIAKNIEQAAKLAIAQTVDHLKISITT